MKLKVCGMRDTANLAALIELNPDYIGFIFYEKSKRYIESFPEIDIPPHISKVGVFVNEESETIQEIAKTHQLEFVQLHGNETVAACRVLKKLLAPIGTKIIKAFAVDDSFEFDITGSYIDYCDLFLFDTKGVGYGGTGKKFNWSLLDNYTGSTGFLLSGGICLNDGVAIVQLLHPNFMGVDINSGFEIEPGLKNIGEIRKFKSEIR